MAIDFDKIDRSVDLKGLQADVEDAKKNLVKVPVIKGTIPHKQEYRYGGSLVMIRPAAPGTGIIAGGAMRAVLESLGIKNVLAKSKGSSNPHNLVSGKNSCAPAASSAQSTAASVRTRHWAARDGFSVFFFGLSTVHPPVGGHCTILPSCFASSFFAHSKKFCSKD